MDELFRRPTWGLEVGGSYDQSIGKGVLRDAGYPPVNNDQSIGDKRRIQGQEALSISDAVPRRQDDGNELPFGATENEGKVPDKLLQQIVSHPEFTGLLQTIATNQFAQAQRASAAIPTQQQPPAQAQAPAPVVNDPFGTRIPGKDQSRVPQGQYGAAPGDR